MEFDTYSIMKNLITNKYYKSKEKIYIFLEAFHDVGEINDEQYTELKELTENYYSDENK